jgi:polysaccharide biosynthesis transport protein
MNALNAETFEAEPRAAFAGPRPTEFQRMLLILRRRRRLFLTTMLIVFSVVALLLLTMPSKYAATATVLIDEHTQDVLGLNALNAQDAAEDQLVTDSSAVDTQVEVLRSTALASQVVDQLHLDQDPEFNTSLAPPTLMGEVFGVIGHIFPSPPGDPALAAPLQHERVVEAVIRDTDVKRTGLTYTIDVTFTSQDRAKAQTIANAFVQAYLTQGLDTKVDATNSAASWLDQRLNQLRQDVQIADDAVEQYTISNNLMSGATNTTLTEQEVSTVTSQLAQARADEAAQDARLATATQQLAAGSNGGDIAEALNNPVVQALRTQQAAASAQLADLQSRYGEKYPDVIKAKRALADLNAQIQIEIQRVLSNLKALSQAAHTRTASLEASLAQTKGSLAGNNRSLVRLNQLQSNDDAAKAIYQAFLGRYKEALAKQGVQAPDARMASAAKLPTSAEWPNKKIVFAVGLVLAAMAGGGAVVGTELLKQGVFSSAEIEEAFDLPSLAELPTLASTLDGSWPSLSLPFSGRKRGHNKRLDPVAYVVSKPLSRFAEAFRNLRAAIATCRTGTVVKVVAVTSSLPGEGKTTTAMCLGRSAAQAGMRVLVIDCDLRQRSINRMLSLDPTIGLIEVLNGTAPVAEALVQDSETGLVVLPVAKSAFTPKDLFGAATMGRLLGELRRDFDLIILDTAPVLAVADTRVICPYADAVVMLTRWRRTPRKAVTSALKALDSPTTFVAGAALTQVDLKEQARVGEGAGAYERAYKKYYVS